MFLTMEAIDIGRRSGVSIETLISIIDASSGSNFFVRNWPMANVFFSDFSSNLTSAQRHLALCRKDLKHALAIAESDRVLPVLGSIVKALEELDPSHIVDRWPKVLK